MTDKGILHNSGAQIFTACCLRREKGASPLLAFNTSYTRGESFMNRVDSWE